MTAFEDFKPKNPDFIDTSGYNSVPAMSIVIMIVGSRGDVQPFIALGKELKKYGHRVRLATHGIFRQFVMENGLEFYPLAGDPNELMAYMVKNPGLLPSFESVKAGDIGKKRKMIEAILDSTYKACVSADPEDPLQTPFVCHAIISNPPAFGHIHCAQRLFVPCHIFFTMPWSPTKAFPHPLVNVNYTKSSRPITNMFSYELVEFMTWEGLGDVINNFRKQSLGLPKIPSTVAPSMLKNLEVPHTYTWSEALIPKPSDWGPHIDIVGFFFLDLASNYTPPPDLVEFLNAGPPPVYIGFGSIVVDDPDALTQVIFDAVEKAGVRALVSKGWGGLGGEQLQVPSSVYLIGNCPHDWLFQHVSAVVHHGGAGTTAAGLKAGKPTIIVPFFGDQPFWGAMVASIGAGPAPIHNKKLNAIRLASAITFAILPETIEAAKNAAIQIKSENGVVEGARSFHRHLPLQAMRCDVDPARVAVWYVPHLNMKISRFVADAAVSGGRIRSDQLLPYRYSQWEPESARSSSYFFDKEEHEVLQTQPGIPSSPLLSSPHVSSPHLSSTNLQPPSVQPAQPPLSPSGGIRKAVSQTSMRLMHSITGNVSQGAKIITGKITSMTATAAYATANAGGKTVQTGIDTIVKSADVAQKSIDAVVETLVTNKAAVQKGVEKSVDMVNKGYEKGVEHTTRSIGAVNGGIASSSKAVQKGVEKSVDNVHNVLSTLTGRNSSSSFDEGARPRRLFGKRRGSVKTLERPSVSPSTSLEGLAIQTTPSAFKTHIHEPIPESPREVVLIEQMSDLSLNEKELPLVEDAVDYPSGPMERERALKRFDTISSQYSQHADEAQFK
ncbi:hypothetical protein BC829DRAFT_73814 [Chytridium lagenaria]|nr:hypothetical protein BC829DRAFT_73814 [Chytridium lagenaria]